MTRKGQGIKPSQQKIRHDIDPLLNRHNVGSQEPDVRATVLENLEPRMTRCVFVCCTSSHSLIHKFLHKRLSIIGFYAQLDLVCEF